MSDLQGVVDAYTLPFAVVLLSAGTLGDCCGRNWIFLVGLIGFIVGSGLCGVASDLQWLIVGRALQGVGGAVLATGSLSLLAAAFDDPRERAAFVIVEARSAEPMLPLDLIVQVVVSATIASVLILGFALFGTAFFLPQYFQAIQGFSSFHTGLRVLPFTMGLFHISPLSARIAARYGFRAPIVAGALTSSGGLLLLADIAPQTPDSDLWWRLAVVGLGDDDRNATHPRGRRRPR